jgi:2-keto-4-pentenoate hydratase/2-oxohepta-3-ene-1,7-dioic acid hydratase in catechol pathway
MTKIKVVDLDKFYNFYVHDFSAEIISVPTSSFLHAGVATATVEIPEPLESLHHEVELAVVISRRGRDIPEASAMDFVGGKLRIASQ